MISRAKTLLTMLPMLDDPQTSLRRLAEYLKLTAKPELVADTIDRLYRDCRSAALSSESLAEHKAHNGNQLVSIARAQGWSFWEQNDEGMFKNAYINPADKPLRETCLEIRQDIVDNTPETEVTTKLDALPFGARAGPRRASHITPNIL